MTKLYFLPCTQYPESGATHLRYVYKQKGIIKMYEEHLK